MDKSKIAIIILSVVLVISLSVTAFLLISDNGKDKDNSNSTTTETPLPPDYPPKETESNQEPITEDSGGSIQTPEGGGAVNITYAETVNVDLSDKIASLYYANPSRSNQNVAIAVVIGDTVIVKSELITPGNMVTELALNDGAENKLSVGSYDAEIVVYCYHPETGEKAMIDARANIILNVVE